MSELVGNPEDRFSDVAARINQRTNGPVNAQLISVPNLSIKFPKPGYEWLSDFLVQFFYIGTVSDQDEGSLDLDLSYTFIYSFSLLYQPTSRSQAGIISKESIIVTFSHIKG